MNGDLDLKGITVSFGKERVLWGLDLHVPEGKIMSVLGPSGCGKSTMLRVISGLVRQGQGTVSLGGKCIDRLPPYKRNMGFVFQDYSLFSNRTVFSNIDFGLGIRKIPKKIRKKRISELLDLMDLTEMRDKRPHQLSGGQKQRVAIARALATSPDVLLLDEPFSALDMKIRKKLRRDLRKIQREFGTTMIFVTHDQEEAFELGDMISIMHGGRIEQCGDPMELYDGPSSLFVSSFLGEANLIDIKKDKGAMVMIRPENVQISKKGSCWYESGTEGVITELIQLGPMLEYKVLLKNGDTIRSVCSRSELRTRGLKAGDEVSVRILGFKYLREGGMKR